MFSEPRLAWILRGATLVLASIWLLFVGFSNEIPADPGDGIMHFFYAQASWNDPSLFMHHWGKPVFILLSSAFAQAGFHGMILFNVLVFTGTVVLGYKILDHFGCNRWIQGMLPCILVLANDYTTTIVGGLTEPLFNLALGLAFFLFIKEKYMWFAILVSFMPFMRSEGQLPLMLAAVLLYLRRSYKMLPFLLTGFMLYAIVGVCASHSFWWFFTESPYQMDNDIYGKGTWDHYLLSYKFYLGNPGLYVFILGTISAIILLVKKNWKSLIPLELLFGYGVFFGIIAAHSYFWATGQNGSLGLTRIATQGMPLFVILQLYFIGNLILRERGKRLFGAAAIALMIAVFTNKHFPVHAAPMEQQLLKAADYLKKDTPHRYKVHYHYPLLVFAYGENPFVEGNRLVHSYFQNLSKRINTEILPGEFVVWDSHFGPQEAGLPLDTLKKYDQFVKVNSLMVGGANGSPEGVIIYQYIPKSKQVAVEEQEKEVQLSELRIRSEQEFLQILDKLPKPQKRATISFELMSTTSDVNLVYDHNRGENYIAHELKKGKKDSFTFEWPTDGTTAIYIWNPNKKTGKIAFKSVKIKEQSFHPVMP